MYHSWTLDGASDTHVCNDPTISDWTTTRNATPDDIIFAGKTSYSIEAFGTVTVVDRGRFEHAAEINSSRDYNIIDTEPKSPGLTAEPVPTKLYAGTSTQ